MARPATELRATAGAVITPPDRRAVTGISSPPAANEDVVRFAQPRRSRRPPRTLVHIRRRTRDDLEDSAVAVWRSSDSRSAEQAHVLMPIAAWLAKL
jgi:hypothetical protein